MELPDKTEVCDFFTHSAANKSPLTYALCAEFDDDVLAWYKDELEYGSGQRMRITSRVQEFGGIFNEQSVKDSVVSPWLRHGQFEFALLFFHILVVVVVSCVDWSAGVALWAVTWLLALFAPWLLEIGAQNPTHDKQALLTRLLFALFSLWSQCLWMWTGRAWIQS